MSKHTILFVLCLGLIAWAAATEVDAQIEEVPQISYSSTDSLESDLESLREGLKNAPDGSKSALDIMNDKLRANEAVTMTPSYEPNAAQSFIAADADSALTRPSKTGRMLKRAGKAVLRGGVKVAKKVLREFGIGRRRRRGKGMAKRKSKAARSLDAVKQELTNNVNNIDGHLKNIVQNVDNIMKTKQQFSQAVASGAASRIRTYELAAKKAFDIEPPKRVFVGRTSKDVIDCTACRFAWLKIEQDLGNTYSEKALYDSFVTHCANMQMTNIFFSPCNDMFMQVDDMIGDYLNGKTVNQVCMHARMCR